MQCNIDWGNNAYWPSVKYIMGLSKDSILSNENRVPYFPMNTCIGYIPVLHICNMCITGVTYICYRCRTCVILQNMHYVLIGYDIHEIQQEWSFLWHLSPYQLTDINPPPVVVNHISVETVACDGCSSQHAFEFSTSESDDGWVNFVHSRVKY